MEDIDSLHEGEFVELDLRRFRGAIAAIIGIWLIPAIFILAGFYFSFKYAHLLNGGEGYLYLTLGAMLALVAIIAIGTIEIYNRHRLILTNRRIVIVTQNGLSGRRVAQCHLEFIQDVSTNHPNFLAELFDFGDISIETAGKEEKLVFQTCHKPRRVAAAIVKLCRQLKEPVEVVNAGSVQGEITQEPIVKFNSETGGSSSLDAEFEIPRYADIERSRKPET